MMSNKEIARTFRQLASLSELHGINDFKVRSYKSAQMTAESTSEKLADKDTDSLKKLGFSKGMAEKVREMADTGTLSQVTELMDKTPKGVYNMLSVSGLGAKKVKMLWEEAGIESLQALKKAAEEDRLSKIKGFGKKTQANILEALRYMLKNEGRFLLHQAEPYALHLEKELKESGLCTKVSLTGQLRRFSEIIDRAEILAATENRKALREFLETRDYLETDTKGSGIFTWRGLFEDNDLPLEVHFCTEEYFASELFLLTSSPEHKAHIQQGSTLRTAVKGKVFESEEKLYGSLSLPFIPPEMREGFVEFEEETQSKLNELLAEEDLKGVLHAHSTYSDGRHSLREMAEGCKNLGYDYFGITDHSRSAFYANGLDEDRIAQQQTEIDELNKEMAPFVTFKGIESDILNDGSLDYSDEILKTFDFVIASVHSNLNMSIEQATNRIVKAVENPYTTILGHSTGRLLLRRKGYPLDFEKVLDACAANGVSVEINANPHRLDLDWRLVRRAVEKGIMLSINPDAHGLKEFDYTRFGVRIGRKAGLLKEQTLNTLKTSEINDFFKNKGK